MGLQHRWSTFSGCCLILAERESRICTLMYSSGFLPISSNIIKWNILNGEPTVCMKLINLHKNPDRDWGSKFVVKRSLDQFNQTQIRTRNGSGALVQSDEINSESQTFHRPSVDGPRPLTFDPILPIKLYSSLVSERVVNTAPTDNKTPRGRIKCDSHNESESTLLAVLLIFGAF